MTVGFHGRLVDRAQVRIGFVGCGSHAFRNLYPALQFAPVELVATCDLDLDRATAFARQFGAERAYRDLHEMLERENLDAVLVCTGYSAEGRPLYPEQAVTCLECGVHVWIEKPPAATCAELERVATVARRVGKRVMVGFKKGFAPANRKAAELMRTPGFGRVQFVSASYPQGIPTQDELDRYLHNHEPVPAAVAFLDHLCHPMSLLVSLVGAPVTLFFQRAPSGAGVATFTHPSGAVSVLHLSHGASWNGGLERTCIVGDAGQHIVVENNVRVSLHRNPVTEGGYGAAPDFYGGGTDHATALWEPEFSLGQLYNKGLFLLGYYGEITEFAAAVLEDREPIHAGLRDAWAVTHTFRAFARGEGRVHALTPTPEL